MTLLRSERADGLRLTDGQLEWSGALADGTRLQFSAPLEADPAAVDLLVRRTALPAELLDELARHFLECAPEACLERVTGRVVCDGRWLRALARQAIARGLVSGSAPTAPAETLIEPAARREVRHLRVLPDGTVAALETPQHFADPRPTHARLWLGELQLELEAPKELWFSLPTPERAAEDQVLVSAYDPETQMGTFWRVDGKGIQRTWHFAVASFPQMFSFAGDQLWIHGERHHTRSDGYQLPRAPDRLPGRLDRLGNRVAVFSPPVLQAGRGWISQQLTWLDLDGDEAPRSFPWDHETHAAVSDEEGLWITSSEGLWRADPEPRQILSEECFGLAQQGSALWVAARGKLLKLDGNSTLELKGPPLTFRLVPLGKTVLALAYWQWTWFDESGQVLDGSAERRDTGWARLRDGTVACSAGEEVLVVGADGQFRRRLHLPYDGQILGATATHFIYGPVSGGIPQSPPTGLYAIDGEGRVTERLPGEVRPLRIFYGGGSTADTGLVSDNAVFVVAEGKLLRWSPGEGVERAAVQLREPRFERDVSSVKWETYNPRDDWPEPGLEVKQALYTGVGCTYGGTTGVAPAEAVIGDDGAVVTLIGCKLLNGGRLRRGSTAILVGCTVEGGWQIDPDCHVAVID